MIRRLALLVLLAPLAACHPKAAEVASAPALPPDRLDISRPIKAQGTDPAWALAINGKSLTLTRPDAPPVTAQASRPVTQVGQARWEARSDDGHGFTVTLYSSPCTDRLGKATYTMTAEVDLVSTVLNGCAARTGAAPKAG